jgi:hypothetical protein
MKPSRAEVGEAVAAKRRGGERWVEVIWVKVRKRGDWRREWEGGDVGIG